MDIPTAPPGGPEVPVQPPLPDVGQLRESLQALNTQQRTLRDQASCSVPGGAAKLALICYQPSPQIIQSEGNLSAQERVTQQTQAALEVEAVKKARWEYLQLLSKVGKGHKPILLIKHVLLIVHISGE